MAESFSNAAPQFGTAEYVGKTGNDHCRFCHQPIAAQYYRVNDGMACDACIEKLRSELAMDTHSAFMRALAYGAGAAIVGLTLYAAFAIVTGIMIGYVALAVGWMIGKAMKKGSGGVGGRRYQIAAILLTYAAVSMAAVPVWIHYAGVQKQRQAERQKLADEQGQLGSGSGNPRQAAPAQKNPQPQMGIGAWLGRVALLGLASPFIEVWSNGPSAGWMIGLVILFVGMRFAWKITAAPPVTIFGPFGSGS
jgi:hypothetical protein